MSTRMARFLRISFHLLAVATVLSLASQVIWAKNSRSVYLPLVFNAEGRPVATAACLLVTERTYPQTDWWTDAASNTGPSERALKAVVAAIRRKDRAALYHLSHPALGRDAKQFDVQAEAYFQQFAVLDLVSVTRAYEFDGFSVFFAHYWFKERSIFGPLVFAAEDDGSFGFLPYRAEAPTYRLVEDWFNAAGRPAATAAPAYCGDEDIKRATHRISLGTSADVTRPPRQPSVLFLRGAPLDRPGNLHTLAARIRSAIAGLKSAAAGGSIDDLTAHLTPEGGRQLKEWFATADQAERRRYETAIVRQQPFFLFDLSPVAVVYTKSPAGVQVMYFTAGAGGAPLWVNSSYITVPDRVFKTGPLYDAALQPVPFGSIAIK
jgi:hypothetical protein